MSDECIRQAPTSAFAHGDADITFRQTCIGKHAGKAEILDCNLCITAEIDFVFVAKDYVKSTAENS